MNKEQAINILIQAVELATLKGAYRLDEAGAIAHAVNMLKVQKQDDTSEPTGDTGTTGTDQG